MMSALDFVQKLRNQLPGELKHEYITQKVLGNTLYVRRNIIRTTTDYDDAWLYACALRAENVFDIGANMGQSTILISLSPSIQNIIAVDANADALTVAADNLIHNHVLGRTRFVSAFVSDKFDQTVTFWTVGTGAAGSMYQDHAVSAKKSRKTRQIPTTTIDTLMKSYSITPDLIKIDIEGAERLALAGATSCASYQKTRFLVEMHSNPELPMRENAQSVLVWCKENNYAAWYLKEKIQLTDAETIAHRGRCHLLLQPVSWAFPDWLIPLEQGAALEKVAPI